MKRAINILIGLVLFVAQVFAQVQPDPRVLVKQAGATTGQVLKWDGTKWAPATDNGNAPDSTFGNGSYYSPSYWGKAVNQNVFRRAKTGFETPDTIGAVNIKGSFDAATTKPAIYIADSTNYLLIAQKDATTDSCTDFQMVLRHFPDVSEGGDNSVFCMGFNVSDGGGKIDPTKAGGSLRIENKYDITIGGGPKPGFEFHIPQVNFKTGIGSIRPLTGWFGHEQAFGGYWQTSQDFWSFNDYKTDAQRVKWGFSENAGVAKGMHFLDTATLYLYKNNVGGLVQRNSANSAFINLIKADADNQVLLGGASESRVAAYNHLRVTNSGIISNENNNLFLGTTAFPVTSNFESGNSNIIAMKRSGDPYTATWSMFGSQFYLQSSAGTSPFGIYLDAPQYAFFLRSSGNIGINEPNPTQKMHITGNLRVSGTYQDSNNEAGTAGQVLSATGTGTDWVTISGDGNGIYGGSGTVPNNTTATVTDDLTFNVSDATGNQDAKFRIVATGTDPGVQVWRNGADSLQLSFIDSEPHLTFAGSSASDFWINTGAHDLRVTGASFRTYPTQNIFGGYVATPYLQVTDNVTVSEDAQEIDIIGNTGAVTLTFQYTSNVLGSFAKTVTVRNRSAYNATLSRGAQSWQWSDMTATNTTADKTLAPGETAKMFWVDAGATDYYVLHIMPATFGGSTGETIISPSQLTAAADNWNPTGLSTATVIRLSGDNLFRIISGITAPASAKELTLTNVGADYPVLITREDAASSAANRFAIARDIPLYPLQSATFYYDATSSRWRCRNKSEDNDGNYGKQIKGVYVNSGSVITGDFDHWTFTTASGTISTNAPTATRPRNASLSTSTSAVASPNITTKAAAIYLGKTSTTPNAIYTRVVCSVDALSDGTNTFTVTAGITANTSAFSNPADGAYFRYVHSANSGKWLAVTRTGGAETTTDSGVTVAANTVYNIEVFHRPDNSDAFFLNGAYIGEHTTNTHDGYAYPLISNIKSAGTTARVVQLDAIEYVESRL